MAVYGAGPGFASQPGPPPHPDPLLLLHGSANDPRATFQHLYQQPHLADAAHPGVGAPQQATPLDPSRSAQPSGSAVAASSHGQPAEATTLPPGRPSELIAGKLLYVLVAAPPHDTHRSHYFSIDDMLLYEPFFKDFGPLHLAKVKRFVDLIDAKLRDPQNRDRCIYLYSLFHDRQRATNASCLAALYCVLRMGLDPYAAVKRISNWAHCWTPYADASPTDDAFAYFSRIFGLNVIDVVAGVHKAMLTNHWIDIDAFNPDAYEASEQLINGDWNWIIPGEALAFSGPGGPHTVYTVAQYIELFRLLGVNTIVRLNEPMYDSTVFVQAGFRFVDLFFPDGSNPPPHIVERFLALFDKRGQQRTVAAVHCKAGLGRTGTLIALRMMSAYGFTARESMGWARVCRPGSVLGPQQLYLCEMEEGMLRLHGAAGAPLQARGQVGAAGPSSTTTTPTPTATTTTTPARAAHRRRSSSLSAGRGVPPQQQQQHPAGVPGGRSRSPAAAYRRRSSGGESSAAAAVPRGGVRVAERGGGAGGGGGAARNPRSVSQGQGGRAARGRSGGGGGRAAPAASPLEPVPAQQQHQQHHAPHTPRAHRQQQQQPTTPGAAQGRGALPLQVGVASAGQQGVAVSHHAAEPPLQVQMQQQQQLRRGVDWGDQAGEGDRATGRNAAWVFGGSAGGGNPPSFVSASAANQMAGVVAGMPHAKPALPHGAGQAQAAHSTAALGAVGQGSSAGTGVAQLGPEPTWWARSTPFKPANPRGGAAAPAARTTPALVGGSHERGPSPSASSGGLMTSGPRDIPVHVEGPSVLFSNGPVQTGPGGGSGSVTCAGGRGPHVTAGSSVHYAPLALDQFVQLR